MKYERRLTERLVKLGQMNISESKMSKCIEALTVVHECSIDDIIGILNKINIQKVSA